ncbi:MAG TPA: CBS domain-containing protein [Actinomycetota bacterium]|nr:CBS domain-containing protein [Actinomycetota bacterium]
MNQLKVGDVMTNLVVKLYPDDTVHEAAQRLVQNDISGAPVVKEGKVVGILSEADLMRMAVEPAAVEKGPSVLDVVKVVATPRARFHDDQNVRVMSIMSSFVVTVAPEATVWEAARLMERHGVKRLPVTDPDGYLVGIVSRADLIKVMARDDAQIRAEVVTAIDVLGIDEIEDVRVQVEDGEVTLRGSTPRRTSHDIIVRLATQVPGVVGVRDHMGFERDDTKIAPLPHVRDPWANGPLVKEA